MKDLVSLDVVSGANEGFELRLTDPTGSGEDLGIVITVLGRDSNEYRKMMSEQNRRRLAKLSKGGSRLGSIPAAEDIEQDVIQLLAACTKAWKTAVEKGAEEYKPVLLLKGEEIPCTTENAVRLYTNFPWIREQVDMGVADRANFIKK